MPQARRELPPFSAYPGASTAGKVIIDRLPQGFVYDGIILEFPANLVAADLSLIELKAGGKAIWSISGADLDAINQWQGLTKNASYLPIWFVDRTAKTVDGRRFGALDTRNQFSSLSLEITYDGTQTATANATAYAIVGGAKKPGLERAFRALIKTTHTPAAAGEFDLDISTGSSAANVVRHVHMKHSNATHVQIKKDNVDISTKIPLAMHDFVQDESLRNNQSGYFTYDFIPDGVQADWLDVRNPQTGNPSYMRWMITVSGSDTIDCYTDLLVPGIEHF